MENISTTPTWQRPTPVVPLSPPSNKKRILVLEADESILEIISIALSHAGHEVETTQRQEEAFDWFLYRGPYDLVMAGLISARGMTLLTRIRNICPSQPVAILTACYDNGTIWELEGQHIPVLLKPFVPLDELQFDQDAACLAVSGNIS